MWLEAARRRGPMGGDGGGWGGWGGFPRRRLVGCGECWGVGRVWVGGGGGGGAVGGDGGGWGVWVPFQRRRLVGCRHASRPEPAPANATRVRSARATVALRFRHLGG